MANSIRKSGYKKLIVYQKSKLLAIDITRHFSKKTLPKTLEFIIIQLLRSACSIGANIAEGYGRHYKKTYRQFLSVARGSCFETEYWLELILELNITDDDVIRLFIKRNSEVAKMLTVMMKKLE